MTKEDTTKEVQADDLLNIDDNEITKVESKQNSNKGKTPDDILGDNDGRVYEVGYLLVSTLNDNDVIEAVNKLKTLIKSSGAEVISDGAPNMITLAYPMFKVINNENTKFDKALFGWIKFDVDNKKITEIKKGLDLDVNIIRHLLIKTTRENIKSPVVKEVNYKIPSYTRVKQESVPIDQEIIDKEIDELLQEGV